MQRTFLLHTLRTPARQKPEGVRLLRPNVPWLLPPRPVEVREPAPQPPPLRWEPLLLEPTLPHVVEQVPRVVAEALPRPLGVA